MLCGALWGTHQVSGAACIASASVGHSVHAPHISPLTQSAALWHRRTGAQGLVLWRWLLLQVVHDSSQDDVHWLVRVLQGLGHDLPPVAVVRLGCHAGLGDLVRRLCRAMLELRTGVLVRAASCWCRAVAFRPLHVS